MTGFYRIFENIGLIRQYRSGVLRKKLAKISLDWYDYGLVVSSLQKCIGCIRARGIILLVRGCVMNKYLIAGAAAAAMCFYGKPPCPSASSVVVLLFTTEGTKEHGGRPIVSYSVSNYLKVPAVCGFLRVSGC
jgi:hypothetical protein